MVEILNTDMHKLEIPLHVQQIDSQIYLYCS